MPLKGVNWSQPRVMLGLGLRWAVISSARDSLLVTCPANSVGLFARNLSLVSFQVSTSCPKMTGARQVNSKTKDGNLGNKSHHRAAVFSGLVFSSTALSPVVKLGWPKFALKQSKSPSAFRARPSRM